MTRTLIQKMYVALQANHKHHQDYDDYNGYPESTLEVINTNILIESREYLRGTEDLSWLDSPEQSEPKGCLRCNTPKKCAVHGCSPMTWPSEAASAQEPVSPMLLRDVADITDASVREIQEALRTLGLNFNRSTNMALTPDEVVAVCKHLLNAKALKGSI